MFLIFEREYLTGVYLLSPGTETIGSMLVSLWAAGAIDIVAAPRLLLISRWWSWVWASPLRFGVKLLLIELSVENLHLTHGDNPVLKGVSMELRRGSRLAARPIGEWKNHAAAGGRRAGEAHQRHDRYR